MKKILVLLSFYKLFTLQMMQPVSIHSVYKAQKWKRQKNGNFWNENYTQFCTLPLTKATKIRKVSVKCMMMCSLPLESSLGSNFTRRVRLFYQNFPGEEIIFQLQRHNEKLNSNVESTFLFKFVPITVPLAVKSDSMWRWMKLKSMKLSRFV